MKEKIAILCKIAFLAIVVLFLIVYMVNNSTYVLAKRFFNININKYDVIEVENTLSNLSYTGKYEMIIKVGEDRFEEFVSDIGLSAIYEKDELQFVNEEYFDGESLDSGGIFFGSAWPPKRKIWFPFFSSGIPKSVYMVAKYEGPEDGDYKVRLVYKEWQTGEGKMEEKKGESL